MQKPPLASSTSLTLMYMAAFLLCVFFGIILTQVGTPGNYISMIMFAFVIGGYLFSGLYAKTMLLPVFQNTNRSGRSFYTGFALASGLISSGVYIFLAGDFYATGTDALTLFGGLVLGVALMTILFASRINRAQKSTMASLFGQSRASRFLIMLIVIITSLLLLHIQLSVIGIISETYFNVSEKTAILISVFVIGFCIILGGIQSLSIVRMIVYPILVVTFLAPLVWISFQITGNPFPQFSFGEGALKAISDIDNQLLSAGLVEQTDIFDFTSEGLEYDAVNHFAALVSIALGTAAMPHLLQHFRTLPKAKNARRSGVWALGCLLIILTAIPAVAAFVKLDIYTSLLGLQLSELEQNAGWLFALNQDGGAVLSICGAYVTSAAEAIAACGEPADYYLTSNDIIPNLDVLVISSAAFNSLPDLMTIILATGALLAIWSTADGLIFVSANSLSEDGYCSLFRPKSPMGTRLFMSRFFLVILLVLSSYMALNLEIDIRFAFAASISLLSASLFPALLSKIWIRHLPDNAIMIGVFAGFVFTGILLWLSHFGLDGIATNGDEFTFAIPFLTDDIRPMAMGTFGMIMSMLFIWASAIISSRLSNARQSKDTAMKGNANVSA